MKVARPSPAASAGLAALIAALVFLAGSLQISRPGYSVDEEFTEFAVRGIQAHGLPLLPSGLLYDRGLAYSYASTIINGRLVSLACAALSIVLAFALVRRHAGGMAATTITPPCAPACFSASMKQRRPALLM